MNECSDGCLLTWLDLTDLGSVAIGSSFPWTARGIRLVHGKPTDPDIPTLTVFRRISADN